MIELFNTRPAQTRFCEAHQMEYVATHIIHELFTQCPQCQQQFEAEEEAREQTRRQAEQAEWMQKRIEKMLGHAAIPKRFLDKPMACFQAETGIQQAALAAVQDFTQEFAHAHSGRFLILYGGVGTGKTHLACGMAQDVIKKYRKSAVYTTASRMFRKVREAKSFESQQSETQMIRAYSEPDLLIIDELGMSAQTEAENRTLFEVINERYERCLPCVLISNLDLPAIRQVLGERIFDRIRENGGTSVLFNWASQRARI